LIALFDDTEARVVVPSGEKEEARTAPVEPLARARVCKASLAATFQTVATPSDTEASSLPFGEKTMELTCVVCAETAWRRVPVSVSHTPIIPSS
jgi:hypothetical protein